jgi:hypothetical protein
MWDDTVGPIELLIFFLIAVVLPVIVIVRDDRNWERKPQRKPAAPSKREVPADEPSDIGLSSGPT